MLLMPALCLQAFSDPLKVHRESDSARHGIDACTGMADRADFSRRKLLTGLAIFWSLVSQLN